MFYLTQCALSLCNVACVVNLFYGVAKVVGVLALVEHVLSESIIQTQSLISLLSLSYEMSISLGQEKNTPNGGCYTSSNHKHLLFALLIDFSGLKILDDD